MEEENMDRWQSIAAKSNLMPTAGEFIPKSQINLHQYNNYGEHSHNTADQNSGYLNFNVENSKTENKLFVSNSNTSNNNDVRDNCSYFYGRGQSNHFTSKNKFNNRSYNFFHDKRKQQTHYKQTKKWEKSDFGSPSTSSNTESDNNLLWRRNEGCSDLAGVKSEHYQQDSYKMKWNQNVRGNKNIFEDESDDFKQNNFHKTTDKYRTQDYHYQKSSNPNFKNSKTFKAKNNIKKVPGVKKSGTVNQREQLIELLSSGVLECMVCCEAVLQTNFVWSCCNCFHVFHLKCTIKWAKSSKSDDGWRCPACQNVSTEIPQAYYCFCKKVKNPEWNHQDCPHSCGEVCGKTFRNSCPHKCTLLCHPGPCPPCTTFIKKSCGCGKTTKTVQCNSSEVVLCDNICEKELNCLIHSCSEKCHVAECGNCKEVVAQVCFCGKEHKEVKCTIEAIGVTNYSCENTCQKKLNCGNHFCQLVCHDGECSSCKLTPEIVQFCACGKTALTSLNISKRNSCLDPVPTCNSICGKPLECGHFENPHTCHKECHEGACPSCPLETTVKCQCGRMEKSLPCVKLKDSAGGVRCDKRCLKKRSCGKHKCNQLCCTVIDHQCPLPCNRLLQCGLHRCEETCHKGHCKPCLSASFEELTCECGAEIIFPPVPCGTRRPHCERPCVRTHACDHPPTHNCHSANQCPPCTFLTKKYCHGRHELRKAVPCHQESFSCGLPCGKEINCGKHKCILACHSGPCLKLDQSCTQPCAVVRPECGHICGAPCHTGPCPTDLPCKEMVRVTCECGNRFTTRACYDNAKEYHRIATAKLATKMADLQAGQSIDLNDVLSANKKVSFKTLECNDECKIIERSRRLAIALQIRNPDLSAKLTPRYSEYLKGMAKKDPRFCQMVHDKLTDLVQLAKQSKQKSRSYSFDPMNRDKRHFVHEYCEHFGCESMAYDQEPKRNVVATALKDKSWLPSMSIIEFLQKENSPRKVPVPFIAKNIPTTSQRKMEVLPSKMLTNVYQSDAGEEVAMAKNNEPDIDYFDWRPQN